jgi:hypothetical protein
VVAVGDPGVPVICCASAIAAAANKALDASSTDRMHR